MLDHAKTLAAAALDPAPKTTEERLKDVEQELARLSAWVDGQSAKHAADALTEKRECKHFWVPHGQSGDAVSCVRCLTLGPKGTKVSRLER